MTNKINLVKIGSITSLNDLKEYNINEPYFYNNYLFHYLIITNNLKGLKLTTFPIYKLDEEGYNGFMLAAKYNYYDILYYLMDNYSKYINYTNKSNDNFLHFLDPYEKDYTEFILKYKKSLKKLYYQYNDESISPLDLLFTRGSFKTILIIINDINFDYNNYIKTPNYFNLLLNESLSSKEIVQIFQSLFKKDKNIFSYVDREGNNILFPIVMKDNIKLLKYMNELNKNNDVIMFDYYTPINTYHIFKVAYNKGILTNDFTMAKYIIDNIIDEHNFNETDKNGNNLAHFILRNRINNKDGDEYIEDKILSNYTDWNKMNIDNETPLDYLIKLNTKKYSKYIENVTLEKKPKKIPKKWKGVFKGIKIKENEKKDINIINSKYSHGNTFKAHFTDVAIFVKYLMDKHDKLYIPIYSGNYNNNIDEDIILPDSSLEEYNNYPWLIIWNNKDNYFIHPKLNTLMKKNKKKYDYGAVILSLRLPNDGLHATALLYDFKRNMIERYDPYGNTKLLDNDLDEILKKKLADPIKMKYCDTSCYFPVAGFQTLSDENNIFHQKMGDFGGFCLAWTLWYIEHKNMNKDIEPRQLVRKTLNRFMGMKIKPIEYIRNYANYINKYRIKFLKDIGVPENIASNEMLPDNYYDLLINELKNIYK
jgi:hypothetical protein